MKNETTSSPEIPLDLRPLVSSFADGEDYFLRVEKLPARGRLSNGRNNGDRTWSLKSTDLAGLTYLPPEDMNQPHTLSIKVVRVEGDDATIVALHDIPVTPTAVAPKDPKSDKAPSSGDSEKEVAAQTGARNNPRRSLDISEPTEEEEEEEDEPDYAQALSDQISAARASCAKELDGLLIKKGSGEIALPTESERVARLEQSLKETQETSKSELAAATARYEKAETSLVQVVEQVESLEKDQTALQAAHKELGALKAQQQKFETELAQARQDTGRAHQEDSEAAVEAALATARTEWDEAAKKQFARARQEGSQAAIKTELTKAQATWKAELKRRLVESAADADRQIEESRKEWQRNSDRELAAATTRFKNAEASLSELRHRVESLQETETALATARVEISVLKAQNQASDTEMNERVAAAAKDADQRLEQARTEWKKSSAEELAAARERYNTAAASVESLERRVEEPQANLSTVSDRLRDEAAAAETNPPGWYARAAVFARMGWKTAKWIYRRAIAPVCRFVWRRRPRSAKAPLALAAVAVIVVGVTYYPSYGPAVMKTSEPVIARIKQESAPLRRFITAQIEEFLKEKPEIYEERVTVNVGVANVRQGPSTSAKAVATLPRHTDLKVLERRGNWVLVQIGGEGVQTGWIYNALLVDAESN